MRYGCLGNWCAPPRIVMSLQAPALQIPAVPLQEQFNSEQAHSVQSCPVETNSQIHTDFTKTKTVSNGIRCALFLSIDPPIPLINVQPDASRANHRVKV